MRNIKYLFALMDDKTRFWIAHEVAETKYQHDAKTLFQLDLKVAGKKPLTLITDGLASYHQAYEAEFYTATAPRTRHIRHITLRGDTITRWNVLTVKCETERK
jgi:hypothetical protein